MCVLCVHVLMTTPLCLKLAAGLAREADSLDAAALNVVGRLS